MRVKAVLLAGLLASTLSAQAATVVVFGDSISAAYGLEVNKGWVAKLQQRLDREQPGKHKVINASVSGETTQGGVLRLPKVLAQYQPDVLVLELGGNDGLRGLPVPLMAKNLTAMIGQARQQKARVLLVGMRIPPNYGKAYTEAFAAAFPQVAKATKTPLLPFLLEGVGGRPELMQDDGIHPNAQAQDRLADNVWPHLKPLLKP